MYRKMTLVPTHAGYVYECFYCKSRMETDKADNHECVARHEGHNVIVTDYHTSLLVECLTCPVTFATDKEATNA